jgi:long-chain acyl-CoA synthetase
VNLQTISKLFIKKNGYAGKEEAERYKQFYQSMIVDGKLMFPGSFLHRAAQEFPENVALKYKKEPISYKTLFQKAWQVTEFLQKKGIRPGDRVCMMFENSVEFYIVYYGIWQTGAVIIPLNIFLVEKELEHIVNDAQPAAFIVSTALKEKVDQVPQNLKPPVFTQEELHLEQQADVQAKDVSVPMPQEHDLVALLYTSGTTGFPKGVMLSSKNIMTNIAQGLARIDASPKDSVLAVLPLFHSFAELVCVWGSFFLGASVIVVPKIERRWILQGFEEEPTVVMGVPALYGLFALMKTLRLSTIRYFVSGGDALPDKIAMAFEFVYRRKICNGFGLTECCPLVSADLDDEIKTLNTVGRPMQGIHIRIEDEQGNELPHGTPGVIWVKGDNIMLGYYNAPEQTEKVMKNGWFNTGDLGYIDQLGRLVMTGREKDLIISKGFNIYPQEIENVLFSHPAVLKAGVIGVKNPDVGEEAIAYVLVHKLESNIENELKKICEQNLAVYKIPKKIIVTTDLPLTSIGKVDKKILRALHEKKD